MTHPTHTNASGRTFMFVVVPKGAAVEIYNECKTGPFMDAIMVNCPYVTRELPAGNHYNLIALQSAVTEEQAAMVVDSSEWYFPVHHTRYVDYGKPKGADNKQEWGVGYGNAWASIISLFESLSLPTDQDVAIFDVINENV